MNFKEMLKYYGINQKQLSDMIGIPYNTISNWCRGINTPPAYVVGLIEYFLAREKADGNLTE